MNTRQNLRIYENADGTCDIFQYENGRMVGSVLNVPSSLSKEEQEQQVITYKLGTAPTPSSHPSYSSSTTGIAAASTKTSGTKKANVTTKEDFDKVFGEQVGVAKTKKRYWSEEHKRDYSYMRAKQLGII